MFIAFAAPRQTKHVYSGKLGIQARTSILASAIDHQDLQPFAVAGRFQRSNRTMQLRFLIKGD
jgi:hypothetical protein